MNQLVHNHPAILAFLPLLAFAAVVDAQTVVLVSSDCEGHVVACAMCPGERGFGGLERRATAIARERSAAEHNLLLDAGNWLVGPDTVASQGRVMVAAYNAMAYDVVHLTPADLYWGKAETLALLKEARFAAVSCNLLDADSGKPLVAPYVVKTIGGKKIAVLGVAEPPARVDGLPQQRQLAGIKIRPTAEALDEWLPKAAAEADVLIVLFRGNGRALRATQKRVQEAKGLVAVSGVRAENLPDGAAILATAEHGRSLVRLTHGPPHRIAQLPVGLDLPPDPEMGRLIARFVPPRGDVRSVHAPATAPAAPATLPATSDVQPSAVAPATVHPATQPAPARVAARQPLRPKGLAGVGLTQADVDKAIDRGSAFLWRFIQQQAKTQDGKLGRAYEGYHTLAALALVKTGFHQKNEHFDAALKAYLSETRPDHLGTYAAGTLCMLVEAYAEPRFEPVQRRAARCLLESQGPRGWDYNYRIPESALHDPLMTKPLQIWGGRRPVGSGEAEQWKRATTQPAGDVDGDNSLAQYAVMGLQSAARTGVEVPPETWQRVIDLYRVRQNADGGWAYVDGNSRSYGSMTCAASYALTTARFNIGEKQPAVDEAVERGLGWLAANFTVDRNPGFAYHYYYLYSLERLGRTLDTEYIGPHEWYPLGAKYLLANQKSDGSWHEGEPDPHVEATTAFALLFLARATPPLVPAKREGPGTLITAIVQPPAPRLYVILDCSGSMHAEIAGRSKFDAARDAVGKLLAELPDETAVGLRVYGHRKRATEDGASEDTQLLIPLGPMDRDAVADRLKQLRARGKTPLARSLREAAAELTSGATVDVILLTDGGEDTQPRQDPVSAAQLLGTRKGVTLHVVGFDIGDEEWGRQLREMAAASKGRYWPAQDPIALLRELRAAVLRTPGEFTVTDAAGKAVARGMFGDSTKLPEGQYSFSTTFSGKTFKESFWINPDQRTAVFFDAGKFEVSAPETPTGTPPTPAERPKFCSGCGQPLAATGKFCSGCGARIGG